MAFVNLLKGTLIFNIFHCFWMFVKKFFTFSLAHISKSKKYFNVKYSTYYFHMEPKMWADFQICISAPLRMINDHFFCLQETNILDCLNGRCFHFFLILRGRKQLIYAAMRPTYLLMNADFKLLVKS